MPLNPALDTRARIYGRGAPSSPNYVEQGFGGGQAPQAPSWTDFITNLFQKIGYPGGTVPPTILPGGSYGGGQVPQPPSPQGPQGSWPTPPAPGGFPGAAYGGGSPTTPQPSQVGGPQASWPTPPALTPGFTTNPVPGVPIQGGGLDEGARARASGGPGAPGQPYGGLDEGARARASGGPGAPVVDPRLRNDVPLPPSRPPDLGALFQPGQGQGWGMTPMMIAREGPNWGGGRDGRGG
jgi:hypothetical protein